MSRPAPVVARIELTASQLDTLTRLAGKGRIFMDVNPDFLRPPWKRAEARALLSQLRQANAQHQDA